MADTKESKARISGFSPDGSARALEVTINNKGMTELWIKPPHSDNGYWIEVPSEELLSALNVSSAKA
jgi:hypothetical protein